MSVVIRNLVEDALKAMEAGNFQDFCLEFLPIWNPRFVGLSRFGHTAAGVTRPGTPDLLLTQSDGSQIAVQCGTEEFYWKKPNDVENWKPYVDGKKCIEALNKPVEIVLISTREIPTNRPNTKSEVITLLKETTTAEVTPISREDIGQLISKALYDPPTKKLLESYFPDAFLAFLNEEEVQKHRLGREIATSRTVEASTLYSLVEHGFHLYEHTEDAKQYVLGELDSQSYRLTSIPPFSGIQRMSVDELHLKRPLGKIWALQGVPKIGKTSLLKQLSTSWQDCDIHWYDCPHEEESFSATAITSDLMKTLLPETQPESLLRSEMILDQALENINALAKPTIFIIDNAENLSETGQRQLSDILLIVKRHKIMEGLTVILASNRNLTLLLAATDHCIVAPRWLASELGDLLDVSDIQWDKNNTDNYLDHLEGFSGGHPLYAKALARKCPTTSKLVLSQVARAPAPQDENLSREAQILLYQDILKDADFQNLVQRLSILIGHTPEDVLEVLRNDVPPPITKTAKVIIAGVGGSVIEGNSELGYSVPLVFRDIAKTNISMEEQKKVYEVVGRKLISPQGNVIDAGRATSGIFYLLCAGEIEAVYFWTTWLVITALDKRLSKPKLSAMLSRLRFITILNWPEDFHHQIPHGLMLSTMATAHYWVKEYNSAWEIFDTIKMDAVPASEEPATKAVRYLQIETIIMKATICIHLGSSNPLTILSEADTSDFFGWQAELRSEYSQLLSQCILHNPISELRKSLIQEIIKLVETNEFNRADWCFKLAGNLGVRAKNDGIDAIFLDEFFIDTPFGRMLRDLCRASLLIELRESESALGKINEAIEATTGLGLSNEQCWSHLYQVKGDAAYQMNDAPLAEESYQKGLECSQPNSFDRAWAAWRLGLIKGEERLFEIAATNFKSLGNTEYWARALGARGTLLIKSGNRYEGIQCFHDLITSYYKSGQEMAGSATTIVLHHLSQLKNELEGNPPLPPNHEFTEINTRTYENVLSIARPLSGPILAFYLLATTYQLLNKENDSHNCVIKALEYTPSHEKDIDLLPVVLEDFLKDLSDPQRDREWIKNCVQLAIQYKVLGGTKPLALLAYCFFDQADKDFQLGQATMLKTLLELFKECLRESPSDEFFWKAEVSIREASILKKESGDVDELRQVYLKALSCAKASNNASVIIVSSHALGFDLLTQSNSLEELAKYQFAQIEGIEIENQNFDRLSTLGKNLFEIWRQIDWSRLLASDLVAKKVLLDSAREMEEADIPLCLAEPAMVLLLAKLFNHSGPSVEWANSKCSIEELPPNVLEVLRA